MKVLITGSAGFIGFSLCRVMLQDGHQVYGVDNCNDYYDVKLKEDRVNIIQGSGDYVHFKLDIADQDGLRKVFHGQSFDAVIHLAAQAGVRYSLINPGAYVHSNLVGFTTLLEMCREFSIPHLLYASSSSVYGLDSVLPLSESAPADHPVSLYAATKRSNELLAYSYSHLYRIPMTGLRFFTVYGPWGRPDMAPYLFTEAIISGKPIKVFNYGRARRDFTYIDDIVDGVTRLLISGPVGSSEDTPPHRIFNIGNNTSVELEHFIDLIAQSVGREAIKEYLPMQPGDVVETYADITALQAAVGYNPSTSLEVGVPRYIQWYREYYMK